MSDLSNWERLKEIARLLESTWGTSKVDRENITRALELAKGRKHE